MFSNKSKYHHFYLIQNNSLLHVLIIILITNLDNNLVDNLNLRQIKRTEFSANKKLIEKAIPKITPLLNSSNFHFEIFHLKQLRANSLKFEKVLLTSQSNPKFQVTLNILKGDTLGKCIVSRENVKPLEYFKDKFQFQGTSAYLVFLPHVNQSGYFTSHLAYVRNVNGFKSVEWEYLNSLKPSSSFQINRHTFAQIFKPNNTDLNKFLKYFGWVKKSYVNEAEHSKRMSHKLSRRSVNDSHGTPNNTAMNETSHTVLQAMNETAHKVMIAMNETAHKIMNASILTIQGGLQLLQGNQQNVSHFNSSTSNGTGTGPSGSNHSQQQGNQQNIFSLFNFNTSNGTGTGPSGSNHSQQQGNQQNIFSLFNFNTSNETGSGHSGSNHSQQQGNQQNIFSLFKFTTSNETGSGHSGSNHSREQVTRQPQRNNQTRRTHELHPVIRALLHFIMPRNETAKRSNSTAKRSNSTAKPKKRRVARPLPESVQLYTHFRIIRSIDKTERNDSNYKSGISKIKGNSFNIAAGLIETSEENGINNESETDSFNPNIPDFSKTVSNYSLGFRECSQHFESVEQKSDLQDENCKTPEEIVDHFLRILKIHCESNFREGTLRLFQLHIIKPGVGFRTEFVKQGLTSILESKFLNDAQFEDVISALYFVSFSNAFVDSNLITTNTTEDNDDDDNLLFLSSIPQNHHNPMGKTISATARIISSFVFNALNHIKSEQLKPHSVKIANRLAHSLVSLYNKISNERTKSKACTYYCNNKELQEPNLNNKLQIVGLIDFLTSRLNDILYFIERGMKLEIEFEKYFRKFYERILILNSGLE